MRDLAAQRLRILIVGVDVHRAIGTTSATAMVGPIGACFMNGIS